MHKYIYNDIALEACTSVTVMVMVMMLVMTMLVMMMVIMTMKVMNAGDDENEDAGDDEDAWCTNIE